jgi:hypothetical protein
MLGIGGVLLGKKIAAAAKAEAEVARVHKEQADAETQHARALQSAAEQRERVRHREVLIQEIQRIRILPHDGGWRKSIEGRIVEAKQLGGDDNSLRTQAIASLRELDAYEIKDLPYPASNLGFDPEGRRLYSCWFKDRVIRVWDSEIDETRTLALKGDGPLAFLYLTPAGSALLRRFSDHA